MKGYSYSEQIEIIVDGKIIRLYANIENVEKLERLKDEELKFSETGVLQILGLNDKEALEGIAIDIKNLLSIALGKRIVFDRQTYYTKLESLRRIFGDGLYHENNRITGGAATT